MTSATIPSAATVPSAATIPSDFASGGVLTWPTINPVLGPLTTTFTPPSSCFNIFQSIGSNVGFDKSSFDNPTYFSQAASCTEFSSENVLDSDSNCFPPYPPSAWPSVSQFVGYQIYSPAFICPLGYSTACLSARFQDGQLSSVLPNMSFIFEATSAAGETVAGCCPRYF